MIVDLDFRTFVLYVACQSIGNTISCAARYSYFQFRSIAQLIIARIGREVIRCKLKESQEKFYSTIDCYFVKYFVALRSGSWSRIFSFHLNDS